MKKIIALVIIAVMLAPAGDSLEGEGYSIESNKYSHSSLNGYFSVYPDIDQMTCNFRNTGKTPVNFNRSKHYAVDEDNSVYQITPEYLGNTMLNPKENLDVVYNNLSGALTEIKGFYVVFWNESRITFGYDPSMWHRALTWGKKTFHEEVLEKNTTPAKTTQAKPEATTNINPQDKKILDENIEKATEPLESVKEYIDLAAESIDNGDTEKAMTFLKKAYELDPKNEEVCLTLGLGFRASKEYDKSNLFLEKAILLGSKDKACFVSAMHNYFELGEYEKAAALGKKTAELYPKDSTLYYAIGAIRNVQGNYRGAIKSFTRAIEINSEDDRFYYNRAITKIALNRKDTTAMEDLDTALKINPQHDAARYIRGLIFEEVKGNDVKAIEEFTKAIEVNPKEIYYIARGDLWRDQKEFEKAMKDYSEATRLNSANGETLLNLGYIYFEENKKIMAQDCFYRAGVIFAKQGNRERLMAAIEALNIVNPQSPLIQKLYRRAYPPEDELL